MKKTPSQGSGTADLDTRVLFDGLLTFTSDPVALCRFGICIAASSALSGLACSYTADVVGSHICDVLASVSSDDLGLKHLRRILSGESVSTSCSLSLHLPPDGHLQATGTFHWLPRAAGACEQSEQPAARPTTGLCFFKLKVHRSERVRSCVPCSPTPYLHYPEPVIVISPEPRSFPVLFANQAFLTVSGLSYADVVGRSISLLHTGGGHSRIDDLHRALCATESCFVPMALIRKGADPLATYLQLEPIKLNGRLVHYIGLYKPASSIQLSNAAAAAVQVLDVGVWISSIAENNCVVYCNAAHTSILGRAEAEVLNKPWNCWQDTVEDRAALQQLHRAIAGGTAHSVEVERRLEGGRKQWLECSVTPVCSAGGPVDYYMGMLTDITARKSEGEMLRLMRGALEATQHAVTILDTSTPSPSIIYCNPAFELLSGYSKDQVLRRSWSLLSGPNTDPAAAAQIQEALLRHTPATVELIHYKYSGRKFWDQVSISPVASTSGRGSWSVVVQADSTERKAAEAAFLLRDHALSNLSEGITIADPNLPDSPIVYVNDAFQRITGYSKEEVLGRNCRFLQGPETDMDAVDRIRTATRDGCGITVEILNYRKSGEKFWNLLSITPVKDKGGRLMSLIGVQSNITELIRRKEAEKQLLEAKIAAETATEAKSMFLANMSHEIRTPLNGMIATGELLLASSMSPEQRELTETILESGNTLLGILGDILDFSKIDHGSVVLQNEPVDLRQTIEACIEIVAADALKKRLSIAYSIADSVATQLVIGDSIRIRQVLVNILSNAVKFTEVGEVVVQCGVEALPQDAPSPQDPLPASAAPPVDPAEGGAVADAAPPPLPGAPPPEGSGVVCIHIAVRDSGIGISQDSAKKLFQCFRQGHESMSRKYGGTGLGLAISKRLAELMNGTIWVESELNHGSTFHFTMLAPWAPRPPPLPLDPTAYPGPGAATGSSDPTRGAGLLPPWNELTPAERALLVGRAVLVDVAHAPTAEQVMQSCRVLGMLPEAHSSAAPGSPAFEMAIISIDRAPQAIRAGWKGRPVVALGSRESLPIGMHPLVMVVSTPVKHSRLATALVKSTSLLRWQSNHGGPKLGPGGPPGTEAFSVFKGWRSRKQAPPSASQFFLDETRRTSIDNSHFDRTPSGARAAVPLPPGAAQGPRFPRTAAYISDATSYLCGRPPTSLSPQSPLSPAFQQAPLDGANAPLSCPPPIRTPPSTSDPTSSSAPATPHISDPGQGPPPTSPHASYEPRHYAAAAAAVEATEGRTAPLMTPPLAPTATPPPTSSLTSWLTSQHQQHQQAQAAARQQAAQQQAQPPPTQQRWQQAAQQQAAEGAGPPPEEALRILIAEDNKVNQKVVLKVLQRVIAGCRPDVVENGLEVLAAMERKVYDIILMDIHMPEMDGLEASRLIQERYPPQERPRIIALSADTLKVLHERCKEAGIEEFITKPFRVEDLQRVMKCSSRVSRRNPPLPPQQGLAASVPAS